MDGLKVIRTFYSQTFRLRPRHNNREKLADTLLFETAMPDYQIIFASSPFGLKMIYVTIARIEWRQFNGIKLTFTV